MAALPEGIAQAFDAELRAGARLAEIGCGTGRATVALAEAYRAATFVGLDPSGAAIRRAQARAAAAGVGERVQFAVEAPGAWPGTCFDVIVVRAVPADPATLGRARTALAVDGSVVFVLPPSAGAQDELSLRRAAANAGFTRVRRHGRLFELKR